MPLLPAGPSARSARRCWTGSLWSLHAALRFSIRGGFPGPGVLLSTQAVSRQQQETAAGHSSQSRGLPPPVATLSHPSWNVASPSRHSLSRPPVASPSRWEVLRSFQMAPNPQRDPASLHLTPNHLQKPQSYMGSLCVSPGCVVLLVSKPVRIPACRVAGVPGGLP